MSVNVKQAVGAWVLVLGFSFPLWASESSDIPAQRNLHCRDGVRGYVFYSDMTVCASSRYLRSPHQAEQPVRSRDALLHFRSGEGRPRIIRAAVETLASSRFV